MNLDKTSIAHVLNLMDREALAMETMGEDREAAALRWFAGCLQNTAGMSVVPYGDLIAKLSD